MNADVAVQAARWLKGLTLPADHEIQIAEPVRFRISFKARDADYFGARYVQLGSGKEDSVRFYLVGRLPAFALEKVRVGSHSETKHVLRIGEDDADWYFSGCIENTRGFEAHHPFGPNFCVRRWNHAAIGRIDTHDFGGKPRERWPAQVDLVG